MESISTTPASTTNSSSNSNGTKRKNGCNNCTSGDTSANIQCTKITEIGFSTKSISTTQTQPTTTKTTAITNSTAKQKIGLSETLPLMKMQSKENQTTVVDDEEFKCTTNPFMELLSTKITKTNQSFNIMSTGSNQNGGSGQISSNRLQISGDDGVEDDQNPNEDYDDSEVVIVRIIDGAIDDKNNDICESHQQEYDDVDEGVIADMTTCTDSLPKMFGNLHLNRTQIHEQLQETTQHTNYDENVTSSNSHNNDCRISKNIEGIYCNDICNTATISYHNTNITNTTSISIPKKNPILTFTSNAKNPFNESISQSQVFNTHIYAKNINKCLSQSSSTTTITSSSSPTSSSLSPTSSCCNLLIPTTNSSLTIQCSSSPPTHPDITKSPSYSNKEAGYFNTKLIKTRQFPAKTQSLDLASDDDDHSRHHHNYQHHSYHRHQHHNQHQNQSQPVHQYQEQNQQCHNMNCIVDDSNSNDRENPDIDPDIDEDDDALKTGALKGITNTLPLLNVTGGHCSLRRSLLQRNSICSNSSGSTGAGDNPDSSQNDLTNFPGNGTGLTGTQKTAAIETRPIYPNVPYSPYASPYGSPRSNRRRAPLRESRRISIEKSGSFLQLNQYKLMDQIGQGSYGLVKLAYSEEDSTHYAMKILSKRRLLRKAGLMGRGPKKTTSPLDRVYREIAVLKKLDHPNVVKLTEVLDDPLEDSLYLVFELVQQGEVLGIPTEKPLPEQRAWGVFRDALLGLEYLHYQRIIHADIKPGNLLLAECGRVKIADLGVCNEFLGEDAVMNNGSTAGTPAFRAPETLIPGQHIYSGKAVDIWALGATLYSLVYGNVPFVASSVPVVYERIKNDPLNFPDKPIMTNDLKDLIIKILTKDPTNRITLPQIKQHPWVTANGSLELPTEEENCRLVQVSDEDINSVVKSIPKLDTLILIKTMLKNHSFQNPFMRGISGRAPQPGGSRLERFSRSGRSNSAPGAYHLPPDRQLSSDNILPALSESVASSNNDSSDADGI